MQKHKLKTKDKTTSAVKANQSSQKASSLAVFSNRSCERHTAKNVAPLSLPTARCDTPIYFIIDKSSEKTIITIKDGNKKLLSWRTSVVSPNLHLCWKKITKAVNSRDIVFKNEFEQLHFISLVRKSFACDRRLQFKDLLKNRVSFAE